MFGSFVGERQYVEAVGLHVSDGNLPHFSSLSAFNRARWLICSAVRKLMSLPHCRLELSSLSTVTAACSIVLCAPRVHNVLPCCVASWTFFIARMLVSAEFSLALHRSLLFFFSIGGRTSGVGHATTIKNTNQGMRAMYRADMASSITILGWCYVADNGDGQYLRDLDVNIIAYSSPFTENNRDAHRQGKNASSAGRFVTLQ